MSYINTISFCSWLILMGAFQSCTNSYKVVFINSIIKEYMQGTDSTIKGSFQKKYNVAFMETKYYGASIKTEFVYDIGNEDKLLSISSTLMRNKYGHDIDFRKMKYSFMIGKENYASYICDFDSLGNIIAELGSICVDNIRDENSIDIHFTTIFHVIDAVFVSTPNKPKAVKMVKKSPMFPMLDYITVDKQLDSVLYIEIDATLKSSKQKKVYRDTIFVK